MYLTTHAAVGVLISQTLDRPLWVFLLSALSHFVLDFFPHGDENVGRWVREKKKNALLIGVVDAGLLAAMLVFLYSTQSLPQMALISAGVIGAVVPDLLSNIFPVIHHYTSWFFVVRLIHGTITKMRVRHLVRLHDWFHRLTHNATNARLSVRQGITIQAVIVVVAVTIALQLR